MEEPRRSIELGSDLERIGYTPIQGVTFINSLVKDVEFWSNHPEVKSIAVLQAGDAIGNKRVCKDHYQIYILKD